MTAVNHLGAPPAANATEWFSKAWKILGEIFQALEPAAVKLSKPWKIVRNLFQSLENAAATPPARSAPKAGGKVCAMKPRWRCWLAWLLPLTMSAGLAAPLDTQPIDDLALYIKQRVQSRKTLIIPPGVYWLKSPEGVALPLSGLQGKTLIFDDVKIIMKDQGSCLQLAYCKDVVIRGLTVDYDPPPFSQGRIVKIDPATLVWDVALCADYPAENLLPQWTQVFDEKGALVCPHYSDCTLEVLPGRVVRVTPTSKESPNAKLGKVGQTVLFTVINAPRGPAATIHSLASTKVKFENVTIYSGHTTAFHEDACKQLTYQGCRVIPCPPESDYVNRAQPRLRSTLGAAFISSDAAQGPRLSGCVVADTFSDMVSISGPCMLIATAERKKLRVLAVDQQAWAAKGDVVELLSFDGAKPVTAKVMELKEDGTITDEEAAFTRTLPLNPALIATPRVEHFSRALSFRLDREVKLPRGSLLLSTAHAGNGFFIENCKFGPGRGGGLTIRASKGLINSNQFAGLLGPAVVSVPDYSLLAGGVSSGLTIEKNLLTDLPATAIRIEAPCAAGGAAAPGAHQNIRILNNTFTNVGTPAIVLGSASDSQINNNKLMVATGTNALVVLQISDSENIVTNNNEIVFTTNAAAEAVASPPPPLSPTP
jgi:hypothetical protein